MNSLGLNLILRMGCICTKEIITINSRKYKVCEHLGDGQVYIKQLTHDYLWLKYTYNHMIYRIHMFYNSLYIKLFLILLYLNLINTILTYSIQKKQDFLYAKHNIYSIL